MITFIISRKTEFTEREWILVDEVETEQQTNDQLCNILHVHSLQHAGSHCCCHLIRKCHTSHKFLSFVIRDKVVYRVVMMMMMNTHRTTMWKKLSFVFCGFHFACIRFRTIGGCIVTEPQPQPAIQWTNMQRKLWNVRLSWMKLFRSSNRKKIHFFSLCTHLWSSVAALSLWLLMLMCFMVCRRDSQVNKINCRVQLAKKTRMFCTYDSLR